MIESKTNYLADAATSATLGILAASARHAMSQHRQSWRDVILRTFAAMVTAVFVGFAAKALIEAEPLRFAVVGGFSYAAPEVLSALIKIVNRKGEQIATAPIEGGSTQAVDVERPTE